MTLLSALLLASCAGVFEPTDADASPDADAAPDADALAGDIPGDSVYQLEVALTDQRGDTVPLSVHRGFPVLVSMFYATCPSACPMLIQDIQAIEARLDPAERARLRVLLVSLDPETDTQEQLQAVVERHGLDPSRWTLARTAPEHVRDVAAVLGVSYRVLGDGAINHTSGVTLLDPAGRVAAEVEGLRQDPAPIVEALRGLPRG